MTQADITTAVVVNLIRECRPELTLGNQVPNLCRFADRCEELPAFKASPMPA
jgi:glutathione S-transferase